MSGVEDAPKWFLEFHKEFTTTSLNLTNRLEKIEGKLNEIDHVKHTADAALRKANQNELELESPKKDNKMLQETVDKIKSRMIVHEGITWYFRVLLTIQGKTGPLLRRKSLVY